MIWQSVVGQGHDSRRLLNVMFLLLVAGVFSLAVFVRCAAVTWPGLNSDEAFSWRVATCTFPDLIRRVAGDTHPPLHFILLWGTFRTLGDSPLALRLLSIAFGVAAVPMAYAAVFEARASSPRELRHLSGLVAASIVAVLPAQVAASRLGRMYSLGLLLSLMSSWLLLRAMRATSHRAPWWCGYSFCAAAFVYTHNVALFAVVAQLAYALYHAVTSGSGASPSNEGGDRLRYVALAALVITGLYSPWIPVLLGQAGRVAVDFWIPPLSLSLVTSVLYGWVFAFPQGSESSEAFIACAAAIVAWNCWRLDRARAFFLAQAVTPWLLLFCYWAFTGRSLFYDRYLVFAQGALACFVASACAGRTVAENSVSIVLALTWIGLNGYATLHKVAEIPMQPPVLQAAAERVVLEGHVDDVVIVDRPSAVNFWRYYLKRANDGGRRRVYLPAPDVLPVGHVNHYSSLGGDDVVVWPEGLPGRVSRAWCAFDDTGVFAGCPPGWSVIAIYRFDPSMHAGVGFTLVLIEKGRGDGD